jgi:hypothetical protein
VVAGGDHLRAKIEELLGDGGRKAEAAGGILAVDNEQVYGVCFNQMPQVLMDDVAACRTKDIADEENVHTQECSADRLRDKLFA